MIGLLLNVLGLTYNAITSLIMQHGYLAIFLLMILEAASLPVPSEVILPAVGYFAFTGQLNIYSGFVAAMLGALVGMAIDYYVAYFLGKDVVYKHAHFFHISKERIQAFDSWFLENGAFAVFIARLMPIVRGLINFPAGFAEMPIARFYAYSLPGVLIWSVLLVAFGYYALSVSNAYILLAAIIALSFIMYLVYVFSMRRVRESKRATSSR